MEISRRLCRPRPWYTVRRYGQERRPIPIRS